MRGPRVKLVLALIAVFVPQLASLQNLAAQSPDEFDRAYDELQRGRQYESGVPTGRIELTRKNRDGLLHRYLLLVPESYDAARRYPVGVYLHGGVGRPDPGPGGGWWRNTSRVTSEDQIAVIPLSTRESLWWQASQVENLNAILTELKQTYNVDENRVFATGVSDGGTGVYFLGFRDTTPWAGFLPFIGYPGVLLNPRVGVDGMMHLANLVNKPFFIVNGETDRVYPVRNMAPFLEDFERLGVDFVFTPKPGGHNTSWWPDEVENIAAFMESHPRDPLPDRVLWVTERTDRYNRAHWVVIDKIGHIKGDEDRGALASITYDGASALVDAVREGNTVTVDAYHVPRFTLLISPEECDLARPIRIVTNGEVSFEGLVEPRVATLRKWAARDHDRTMLFAAEIRVETASR